MRAAQIVKSLAREGRAATDEERRALSAFSGWGSVADIFDADRRGAEWQEAGEALKSTLTEDEYDEAESAILTAYYTPAPIADAMVGVLTRAGFGDKSAKKSDTLLEPGCGTGNILARVRESGARFDMTGIEVDDTSAAIAAALNPDARIVHADFNDCHIPTGAFTAAIGNVPYSKEIKLSDPETDRSLAIHDWTILNTARGLVPGGTAVLLTSTFTMDKLNSSVRRELSRYVELAGAVRLPHGTFVGQANTEVLSDVLVLRRREKDLPENVYDPDNKNRIEPPEWTETVELEPGVRCNKWIADHCDVAVVGDLVVSDGRFGRTMDVENDERDPARIGKGLADKLAAQDRDARNLGLAAPSRESVRAARTEALVAVRPKTAKARYEYFLAEDGSVWYGNDSQSEAIDLPQKKLERLRALVRIRDARRELVEEQLRPDADKPRDRDAMRAALRKMTDDFRSTYKCSLGATYNKSIWNTKPDHSFQDVVTLEETDREGNFTGYTDILQKDVLMPLENTPDVVETLEDGVAASFAEKGEIDCEFIATLMPDKSAYEVFRELGDRVALDPKSLKPRSAERVLSGNLEEKRRATEREINRTYHDEDSAAYDLISVVAHKAGLEMPPFDEETQAYRTFKEAGLAEVVTNRGGERNYSPNYGDTTLRWTMRNRDIYDSKSAVDCILGLSREERSGDFVGHNEKCTWGGLFGLLSHCRSERDSLRDTVAILAATLSDRRSEVPHESIATAMRACTAGLLSLAELQIRYEMGEARPSTASQCKTIFGTDDADLAEALESVSSSKDDEEAVRYLSARPEVWLSALDHIAAGSAAYGQTFGGDAMTPEEAKDALSAARDEERNPTDALRRGLLEETRGRIEQAIPSPIEAEEISIPFGATWVPAEVYADFIQNGISDRATYYSPDLSFDDKTGKWYGEGIITRGNEYKCGNFTSAKVIMSALNQAPVNPTKKELGPDGKEKTVPDEETARTVGRFRDEIGRRWSEWLGKNPETMKRLASVYNERFNSWKKCEYDGDRLSFPGMNPEITLRDHQKKSVARTLATGHGTLLGHAVGAGKTFTGVAAAHEAKRLGRCRKPLIAVPNGLTEQWAEAYATLYPADKVLTMTDADSQRAGGVNRFWALVQAGDWDAVIVPQSRFDAVDLDIDRQVDFARARVNELKRSATSGKFDRLGSKKRKDAEKRAEANLKRLEAKQANKASVDTISFEELGVDWLFVDEAHNYKNLELSTNLGVSGITGKSSAKAETLLRKCDYLRETGHGGNIVFATGTPVSNTMSELYIMQRYLDPDGLKSVGVETFNAWAKTFGRIESLPELDPTGTKFVLNQRFSKFTNMPELMAMTYEYADLLTKEQLNLPEPELESETVVNQPSETQKGLVKWLGERADQIHSGAVEPWEDNMLKITSEGRKLALDPKLLDNLMVDPDSIEPEPDNKVQDCADKVHEIWQRTQEKRSTQLVFCDTSTDAGKNSFNIYDDLKRRLVELGIPKDEIASIGEAGSNNAKKQKIFDRVKSGEVRVLLGSTQKLGTGVNVQDKLIAIHNLDCPWRPADLEQRLGRIVRQGNENDCVHQYSYVTKGTFDSYMYQAVERKQRFISQIMRGEIHEREMEDMDELTMSYQEIKACSIGDPRVQRKFMLENEIANMRSDRAAFEKRRQGAHLNLYDAREKVKEYEGLLSGKYSEEKFKVAADVGQIKEEFSLKPKDVVKLAEATELGQEVHVGTWRGLDAYSQGCVRDGAVKIGLRLGDDVVYYQKAMSRTNAGTLDRQLSALVGDIVKGRANTMERLKERQEEIETFEGILTKEWDGAAELRRLEAEHAALDRELGIKGAGIVDVDMTPEKDEGGDMGAEGDCAFVIVDAAPIAEQPWEEEARDSEAEGYH